MRIQETKIMQIHADAQHWKKETKKSHATVPLLKKFAKDFQPQQFRKTGY
jgi:hypothetical protein